MYLFVKLSIEKGQYITSLEFAQLNMDEKIDMYHHSHICLPINKQNSGTPLSKALQVFAQVLDRRSRIVFLSQQEYDVFLSQAKRYLPVQIGKRSYILSNEYQAVAAKDLMDCINQIAMSNKALTDFASPIGQRRQQDLESIN